MGIEDSRAVEQDKGAAVLPEGIPYDLNQHRPSPDDRALAAKVKDWFREAWGGDSDFREEADEDFDFFNSKQWDKGTLAKLREERRPALTINRIKKQIQLVVGFERQNRFDVVARPRGAEPEDAELASVMTDLMKYVQDVSEVQYEESKSFQEGMIGGRGWLIPEIDFTEDPINGTIMIRCEPWRNCLKDPASRHYNMQDGQYFIRHRWLSPFQLKELWPKKAGQIDFAVMVGMQEAEQGDTMFSDFGSRRLRAIECWYKKPRTATYIADETAGSFEEFTGEDSLRKKLEKIDGLRFVERRVNDIWVAVTLGVGGVVLEHKRTPFKQRPLNRMLPVIPFVAETADGKDRGMVRDLKDPQRETNKRRSQLLHILNTSAVPGWKGDFGAVKNPAAFEEQITRPGFVVWKNPNRELERLDAPNPPQAFFLLDEESRRDFFDIGVNPDMMGLESNVESGRAIILRQQQGQLVMGTYFDNWRRTKALVGMWILGLIQQTFNDARVIRITGVRGEDKLLRINQTLGGNPINIVEDRGSGEVKTLGDFHGIEFDIVVTESPTAPTTRLAQLAIITDLMNAGAFENPQLADFILDLSGFDPEVRQRITQSIPQAEVPTAAPTA